jgi:hypothetical protein
MFEKFFSKRVNPPPTRGIRYNNSLHQLQLKNSFKMTSINKNEIPTYKTFCVIWNNNMTSYTLKNTTNYKLR